MIAKANDSFCRKFGPNAKLKPFQIETLEFLASGKNVFSALPTGYGKSLCYWLPAAAWEWKVLVISPLISLMEDQRRALLKLKVETVCFHAGLSETEREENNRKFFSGKWSVCIISPERLARWRDSTYFSYLVQWGLDLVVLDEMHCVEDWRTFREGYDAIYEPMKRLVGAGSQVLGLSASMRAKDSEDWMAELCDAPKFVRAQLGRENIEIAIMPIEEEQERWLILLSALKNLSPCDSALIYCSSRAEVDALCRWLNSAGVSSSSYHAGLPASIRSSRLKNFSLGNIKIICCTSAFGMGVDYPHVRWVIHFSLPYNLNAYWQEVGRAGRSGAPAFALCLWRRSEILRARRMHAAQKTAYSELWLAFASDDCRKISVAKSLGMEEGQCGKCDQCVKKGQGVFSSHLQEMDFFLAKKIWWKESAAEIQAWIREKIFVD